MDEVRAAIRIARKNTIVTAPLNTGVSTPILAKMYGSVSYTSAGPAPGSSPAANTAGIMAKAAMIANTVSDTDVQKPDLTILSPFFMKEE